MARRTLLRTTRHARPPDPTNSPYISATSLKSQRSRLTISIAPPTKERIVKALQAGGEKALEENPYVNVVTAIVKEWQKAQ